MDKRYYRIYYNGAKLPSIQIRGLKNAEQMIKTLRATYKKDAQLFQWIKSLDKEIKVL